MSRRINPVAWSEGMFLQPQHFQHQDLHNDQKLHYHLRAVDPFHWGVRLLEFDEDALSDHRIIITRLDAVLPDGTLIRFPDSALVEQRAFDPKREQTDLFVGIRHWTDSDPNYVENDGSRVSKTRFVRGQYSAVDTQQGGNHVEISVAHPNVRLFLEGEESAIEMHEAIRIGRLSATGNTARPFEFDPAIAPPLLAVEAWPPLYNRVAKIVNQMAGRIRVVVGRTTTLSTNDLPKYWMRYTLARLTPVLRHQLATGFTRPFDLYTALLEAGSALSAFQETEAVELPPYDHNNPVTCFEEILVHIEKHIGEAIPDRFKELKLKWNADARAYETSELNSTLVDRKNIVYLAVKAQMDPAELRKHVVEEGTAGSTQGIVALTLLKAKGLRLEPLPGAPTEIASAPGFEYFRVSTNGDHWLRIQEESTFSISLAKLEDADVRLFVVTPEE